MKYKEHLKNNKRLGNPIWDCLGVEVKIDKPKVEEPIETVSSEQRKHNRILSRLKWLDNKYNAGQTLLPRQVRRYVRLLPLVGREVPEKIRTLNEELKNVSNREFRKKTKIVKVKISNRNRIPKKYDAYIKSKHWERRRNDFYKKYGKICAVCSSSKYVQLHHAIYGQYGKEKDEHLIPLCQSHHDQFHKEIGKTKRDMLNETLQFIADNYQPII